MAASISIDNIEEYAQRLLEDKNAFCGYTRVIEIANKLGLQVISASFKDNNISGMLILNDTESNIYVNAANPIVRQRFTIAHEIGHYVLHNDMISKQEGNIFYRDQIHSKQPIETQANRFAAALLLPKDKILQDWALVKNVVILAAQYNVSIETLKYRLNDLGQTL